MYNDYKDRADFLAVYIREAHPQDEWQMKKNVDENICYPQPTTLTQRVAIANDFTQRFHFPLPLGIDPMNDLPTTSTQAGPSASTSSTSQGKSFTAAGWAPSIIIPRSARMAREALPRGSRSARGRLKTLA